MSKLETVLIVVAIIALLVVFGGLVSQERASITASGHSDWYPVMWEEDGQIVGIGPEVVAKVCEGLYIDVDFSHIDSWDNIQESARTGEVDIIVAAYKTKEREEYMVFSDPYTVDPVAAFSLRDVDLVQDRGLGTIGDSYGQELDDRISSGEINLARVETPQEAFQMVLDGEVDYFLYSKYAGEKMIEDFPGVEVSEIVSEQQFYIAISKKSPMADKLPQINNILRELKDDGFMDQVLSRYPN